MPLGSRFGKDKPVGVPVPGVGAVADPLPLTQESSTQLTHPLFIASISDCERPNIFPTGTRDAVNNINKLAINKVSLLSPDKIINYSLRLIVLIGLSL